MRCNILNSPLFGVRTEEAFQMKRLQSLFFPSSLHIHWYIFLRKPLQTSQTHSVSFLTVMSWTLTSNMLTEACRCWDEYFFLWAWAACSTSEWKSHSSLCSCRRRALSSWRLTLILAVTSMFRLKCELLTHEGHQQLFCIQTGTNAAFRLMKCAARLQRGKRIRALCFLFKLSSRFLLLHQRGLIQDVCGRRLRFLCGDDSRRGSEVHREKDESAHSVSSLSL